MPTNQALQVFYETIPLILVIAGLEGPANTFARLRNFRPTN